MTFSKKLEKICTALGKNNKPTYVVMAIATVKGICRPLFTMMDKKENPETKKYTAIREGLTEVIAIPVYWACGEFAGKFANKLGKPKNFMDKELYSRYKGGDKSEEVINAFKKAAETAEDKLPRMNKNLMFLGVCYSVKRQCNFIVINRYDRIILIYFMNSLNVIIKFFLLM